MADFQEAYLEVMQSEGGYVNDPTDRGGETYCGITKKWFPRWEGWKLIAELKTNKNFPANLKASKPLSRMVRNFYEEEFFKDIRLDEIHSQKIATEVFDTAVNMSKRSAVFDLQRAVNLLNNNGRYGADITVDGVIGAKTLQAVNNFPYPSAIADTINGLQFSRYVTICENDHTQEKFFRGWLFRVKINT